METEIERTSSHLYDYVNKSYMSKSVHAHNDNVNMLLLDILTC